MSVDTDADEISPLQLTVALLEAHGVTVNDELVDKLDETLSKARAAVAENDRMVSELTAQLAAARQTRRALFAVSMQLMSALSWCAGFVSSDDQQVPAHVQTALDAGVRTLSEIDDGGVEQ